MAHTTIPIDPRIGDRLRTFGIAGETYDEILERLMDEAAEDDRVDLEEDAE